MRLPSRTYHLLRSLATQYSVNMIGPLHITKLKSLSVFLSVCLSVGLSFYLSDILLTFLTTFVLITKLKSRSVFYLSVCLSVSLSVGLSFYVSIFLTSH